VADCCEQVTELPVRRKDFPNQFSSYQFFFRNYAMVIVLVVYLKSWTSEKLILFLQISAGNRDLFFPPPIQHGFWCPFTFHLYAQRISSSFFPIQTWSLKYIIGTYSFFPVFHDDFPRYLKFRKAAFEDTQGHGCTQHTYSPISLTHKIIGNAK
jgi:hypothetical protein